MNARIPTLDSWPEQSIRGHSIPGSRYTCRDFMEKEWEGMWTRVWLLLGRESELPEPGDWQMEPVGREEILMVRQQDGSIKAFYNVCQHRGNPLVDEQGQQPTAVCLPLPQLGVSARRHASVCARQRRLSRR